MLTKLRLTLVPALLGCTVLIGSADAGPRKTSTGPRGPGIGVTAVGKIVPSKLSIARGISGTYVDIKITKGNARVKKGETLGAGYFIDPTSEKTADASGEASHVNGDAFRKGIRVTVPGLGTVSPLSATIWQGLAKRGTKQKGPLRLGLDNEITEQMEALHSKNAKLTPAQLFAQVVHEQDQGDVYETLTKEARAPTSLDIVDSLEDFPIDTGYQKFGYLIVEPLKPAKQK